MVVGGSSGIGCETVLRLTEDGWNVFNISRTPCINIKVNNVCADVTEGDAAFNKRLGLQRAKVVKDYLVSKGVEDHRMAVMGGGESEKFDNTTEAGRKLNRRVDIIFGQ